MSVRIREYSPLFVFLVLLTLIAQCGEGEKEKVLQEENKICVYLIGKKDLIFMKDQLPGLESIFNRKIRVDKLEMDLNFAYHPKRGQYHSSAILEKLKTMKSKECEPLLAIVSVDLYVPELNFVFGEADFQTKVAVVSTIRLRQEFYGLPENKQLFLERVKKEVVHELSHTYGLPHCPDPECVMYFSNSLQDTDLKSYFFCVNCKKKLKLKDR